MEFLSFVVGIVISTKINFALLVSLQRIKLSHCWLAPVRTIGRVFFNCSSFPWWQTTMPLHWLCLVSEIKA
jgi:hypothetical protein